MNDSDLQDRCAIRELIGNWVIWRDAGDWESLATAWHADGVMMSTWRQSDATTFIEACKSGWRDGIDVLHSQGPTAIELAGDRAIGQTKMAITQRIAIDGVPADVTCLGRFYDFLERREGRWGIVLRQPIYERDRLDGVSPGATPALNAELLVRYPVGYRHLACVQTLMGFEVKTDMPGRTGPEVDLLYSQGRDWLGGGDGLGSISGSCSERTAS